MTRMAAAAAAATVMAGVIVIPSAAFHIRRVQGGCKGAATGSCECIKCGADPLGDRHAAGAPLPFRLEEVNKAVVGEMYFKMPSVLLCPFFYLNLWYLKSRGAQEGTQRGE